MAQRAGFRGSLGQRIVIGLLSLVFAILFFWLLNFITKDISRRPGPDLGQIQNKYVDPSLLDQQRQITETIESVAGSFLSRRQTSNPLIFGIITSSNSRSGEC